MQYLEPLMCEATLFYHVVGYVEPLMCKASLSVARDTSATLVSVIVTYKLDT